MVHEQPINNVEHILKSQNSEGDSVANAIGSGSRSEHQLAQANKLNTAQRASESVLKSSPVEISGTNDSRLLALRDGPDGKSTIEALKRAYAQHNTEFRKPPDLTVPAPIRREMPVNQQNPQIPGRPVINGGTGQRGETVGPNRPVVERPRVNVETERQNLPKDHFNKGQAKEAQDKAKRLGLPLVVHINADGSDSEVDEDSPRYKQSAHGVFDKLEKDLHGKAVFLYISTGSGGTPQSRDEAAEAKQELAQAKTIAKSIGIQNFGKKDDDERPNRRQPFIPTAQGTPHIAIFDTSGKNIYDQHVTRVSYATIKSKIPEPTK